jgi:transposase
MAMRREAGAQDDLVATWAEIPRSPGHAFYDRLQTLLKEAGFDVFVEDVCKPYYAARMGAPSLPPGRYFRLHMVGYFEGIDSERGIVWRCSDSLSLRAFLRLSNRDKVPDHSWLSKTRSRLPHEVHEKVFGWVLDLVAGHGLVKGERIGVDGSTMEANAALRTIVRRDSGESYREMLTRMAQESGVATPTIDDLVRLDRKRQGKKLSNEDWTSPTDPDAKIARMKDGTTHLAYKPEHAVDLDTGVIIAAPIHPADEGDTTTLEPTLEVAQKNLSMVGLAPTAESLQCEARGEVGVEEPWRPRGRVVRVVEVRLSNVATQGGHLEGPEDQLGRESAGKRRREQGRSVRKDARLAAEVRPRGVVHVEELRPGAEATAVQAGGCGETPRGRGAEGPLQLDTPPVALVQVATQGKADLRQLARLGDLVAEFHQVDVCLDREPLGAPIEAGLDVGDALRMDPPQIVGQGGVVLPREEIGAGGLAGRAAHRGVDGNGLREHDPGPECDGLSFEAFVEHRAHHMRVPLGAEQLQSQQTPHGVGGGDGLRAG